MVILSLHIQLGLSHGIIVIYSNMNEIRLPFFPDLYRINFQRVFDLNTNYFNTDSKLRYHVLTDGQLIITEA